MNDILLIENDVEFFGKHKGVFERSFSKESVANGFPGINFPENGLCAHQP